MNGLRLYEYLKKRSIEVNSFGIKKENRLAKEALSFYTH